jgi:peroxiredoxin
MLEKYQGLASQAKRAKVVREEAIEVGGQNVPCYVVEIGDNRSTASRSSLKTLWIDKTRYIVVREVNLSREARESGDFTEKKTTTVFNIASVNQSLPDELFAFTPPAGAKEISEDEDEDEAALTGQPVSDFTLKDSEGKSVSFKDLHGKIVLINFWATWCGPCRMEMPSIEKLYRQHKDQGLVVLGINDEESGVASAYLKKYGYTFTTLLDPDSQMHNQYQVRSIPTTLVIGKDGKIVAHLVGARTESDFRAALAKAGIK